MGVESVHVRGRPRERADDGADPALGDLAEELHGEMKIPRNHPGHIARHGSQPLDRRPELSSDGVVEQDRDERTDAVYRASSSCSRFRMPCRRSGSVSAASAARRSVIDPGRSPLSSRPTQRPASPRESSGPCAGGIGVDAGAEAGGPVPGPGAAAGAGAVGDDVSTAGPAPRGGAVAGGAPPPPFSRPPPGGGAPRPAGPGRARGPGGPPRAAPPR